MKIKKSLLVFAVCCSLAVYFFYHIDLSSSFIIQGRIERLLALLLVAVTIAYSCIVFQTISANKILTPSLMGYEHLYILTQVLMLMLFGSDHLIFQSKTLGLIISTTILSLYSYILFQVFFQQNNKGVYFILLIGLVLGIFFNSSTQFLQMAMDPNSFSYVQQSLFAMLSKTTLLNLGIASFISSIILWNLAKDYRILNVLSLGRHNAIGLGVDYDAIAKKQLLGIAVLVSISTALIGPITFLGIFVSGMTYRIAKTENHKHTLFIAGCVAIIMLLIAQFIIEHMLNYKYALSIIINLLGTGYFVTLIAFLIRK